MSHCTPDSINPRPPPLPTILAGKINIAADVLPTLGEHGQSVYCYLHRHCTGDWGDIDEANKQANIRGALNGFRVTSRFRLRNGVMLAIRTNAGRTETTIDIEE
jgi:hypothetical protein